MTDSSEQRQLLINELITYHGLEEHEIYLLDLFPLIEMVWSDGNNQASELSFAYEFCLHRIAELDDQTDGNSPLSIEQANAFLEKYLNQKPDAKLLKTIRDYIKPLYLNNSDPAVNEQRKQKILDYCLDIAAAAVHTYPYEKHERFIEEEKQLLKDIIDSL